MLGMVSCRSGARTSDTNLARSTQGRHRFHQGYFEENMSEPIGDLPAGLLLTFFVEEVGPLIYNCAVAEVQARLTQRVSELESELFVPEFQYWPEVDGKRKRSR
jgi:uncharacterized protein (DUF2164 family)